MADFQTTPIYFEGEVAGGRFKIQRFINYQNAWLPVIEGSFRLDDPGTIVTLNMRLMWPLMIFLFGIIALLFWSFRTDRFTLSGILPRSDAAARGDAIRIPFHGRGFCFRGAKDDEALAEASVVLRRGFRLVLLRAGGWPRCRTSTLPLGSLRRNV
jgi:hypothetical protein